MLTLITTTRRPQGFKNLIVQLEEKLGDLFDEYRGFVNTPEQIDEYKKIQKEHDKAKIIYAPEDYIYKNGFDKVYNLLGTNIKSDYVIILFDTDEVDVIDRGLLIQELNQDCDIYSFKMYMERGDVWEDKFQIYKPEKMQWFGLVHENQQFYKQPKVGNITAMKVRHNNAVDKSSKELKKNNEGFIILEKTEEGTDSDKRNMLYETLAWKIVNQNGRHLHKQWFEKHYQLNKEVIDWYYERAKKKYNL